METDDQDESQGDSRETQKEIERLFGMSHEMFKHLVALNTYTEPFLSMKANDQRAIIEQLLGITILSEKAEALKEDIRISKDLIQTENTKLETIKISNEKVQQSIESLERKQKIWQANKTDSITQIEKNIRVLSTIDIDSEITKQKDLSEWTKKKKEVDNLLALVAKSTATLEKTEESRQV
jgi:hypothetical protein